MIGGEHATTVSGNGSDPGIRELTAIAKNAGIPGTRAKGIAEDIREIVDAEIGDIIRSYQ